MKECFSVILSLVKPLNINENENIEFQLTSPFKANLNISLNVIVGVTFGLI